MANFQQLQKVALLTRIGQDKMADPDMSCTIDPSSFTYIFNNVVLNISFSDHVEIAAMRTAKDQTSIPVPPVFAYDVSPSNEVGYSYILMERLDGRVLGGLIASKVPSEYLPKVASQLAEVLFQLNGLAYDYLGRLWCGATSDGPTKTIPLSPDNASSPNSTPQTSLEWFYAHGQEDNRLALEHHPHDPEWRIASRVHGPFPLCHLDLHHGNLLFDDDYNLKGVIDWSQAQMVPMERLVVSPEIITFPAGSDEQNKNILTFKADITHRCTYSLPHRALWDGRLVARLIYGDDVAWEQLVLVYEETDVY
ncbi:kinase-like domain-containing protein [Xylariaceae sp. AK1471]|nr:kinase-like domain-containing protein [Xylariaceae sp. AK1471]